MNEHVDGNALAGPLSELFTVDMTIATGRCAHCDDVSELARAMVYEDDMGIVLRCSACDDVLMTIVHTDGSTCVDLSGVRSLQVYT